MFMSLLSNMRIPVENIGNTGLLCPGITNCSGPRLEIFAKNIYQTRVPDNGGDIPDMFCFESIFGDYCFDSTRRKNQIRIIALIDKYPSTISTIEPGNNPLRTVIFRDLVTGEVSYFNIQRFSSYSNDYGFRNIIKTNIQVDDVINPETDIYTSPSKDGDVYKMGVNANTAYATFGETIEDCFMVSRSLADRLSPISVEQRSITSSMRKYPLNLYGNDEVFKFMPNIGECVRDDGILCAFRPTRRFSALSDLQADNLTEVNHLFDKKIYAQPGAKVVDINVYIDNKNNIPQNIFDQVRVYYEANLNYWRKIVEVYEEVKGFDISFKFNTLVTKAMGRLLAARQNVPGIIKGKQQKVNLINNFNKVMFRIDVTLVHKVIVIDGFKIADRYGTKGVIIVKDDEDMPVDDHGFRADLCIDPVSVLKRTSIIQLYEVYINRILKWQAMNLDKLGSIENQYQRIIEILNDINPEYAKLVHNECSTDEKRFNYVNDCKRDTIKIFIPPGMDGLNKELIFFLENKYKTPVSPLTFIAETTDGKKSIRTKQPIAIGSKYIYLLSKYPRPSSPGFGHVNRCHMPMPSPNKYSSPIGTKSIRFGESESRIFAATVDTDAVLRFKCLYSGSRIGPKLMINALLDAEEPSQLNQVNVSTTELYDDNPSIRIAHHMLNTCGIDMQNSLIPLEDGDAIFNAFKNIL